MKKRIISFLLCVLMLVTSLFGFVGCGDKSNKIFTKDKPKAVTVTITTIYDDYDPSNEKQVEALKQVQEALNSITETKYNTHVVIQPMKSEDYMNQILTMTQTVKDELEAEDAKLEELKQQKAAQKKGRKLENSEILKVMADRKKTSKYQVFGDGFLVAANQDSVYKDDFGRYQTMYPSVNKEGDFVDTGIQLDIVLINSVDMYNTLVEFDCLYLLNTEFLTKHATSNNLIQKYVSELAYDQVDIDAAGNEKNELYAIPNNAVYGEYSYMIVNRELFDKYGYDVDFDYNVINPNPTGQIDDFSDLENFVLDIVKDAEAADVRPVLNNPTLEYLSYFGEKSVMIADATTKYDTAVGATPRPITNSLVFQSYFRTMYALVKGAESRRPVTTEWLTAEDLLTTYKDEKFGVAFAKGNLDMIKQFAGTEEEPGDYYVLTTHAPYIDSNVYESMYAISSCVESDRLNIQTRVERCYQILELFATNSDWVNILTYGVKGEQFEFSQLEEGLVINRSSDYTFDRRYAGNMFLQHLSEDMTPELRAYAENDWDLAKRQNRTATVSPYAGFTIMTQQAGETPGPLTMELPTAPGQKLLVESILNSWKKTDEKYYNMLTSYDHYEEYIAENPNATFDDYYKAVTGMIQKENNYALITSVAENAPLNQYNKFFMKMRNQ